MGLRGSEEPPAKRRRFFEEKEDIIFDRTSSRQLSLQGETDESTRDSPEDSELKNTTKSNATSIPARVAIHTTSNGNAEAVAFDQDTFESFIGKKVASDDIKRLRQAAGNDVGRAVNMYLDGSWKSLGVAASCEGLSKPSPVSASREPVVPIPILQSSIPSMPDASISKAASRSSVPESRYIGAFGVGGWATRSGAALIKHGEPVRIQRQQIQPPKPPAARASKGRTANQQLAPKITGSVARRVDVIVRFTNSQGDEVGRLPKETANWVSTLIDQRVCKFEGTCVYAPERVRTNDTIFLQLRCSLLKTAFDNHRFKPADNRSTGIFEEKETSEEKDLRLRQVALVKLFEEINLLPSKTSETTVKHKRQGLLQAAEVAEQYERDDTKKAGYPDNEGSALPPPSEEAEEGKELEQDQLDSLYKKAQSFDFDAPEAEPADTFAMELRPYQKQALFWMMAKEKDEKEEGKEISMHPLWEEYAWPVKDMDDKDVLTVDNQDTFYVNPYSGELGLDFPIQEQHCLGGILADEMGLGKTIEMMSLIHSHKSDVAMHVRACSSELASVNNLPRLPRSSDTVERAPCTTLVVAPMSLLAQWQSEAENASKDGTMRTMVYYGSEKTANLQTLCCESNAAAAPTVIITSYGVVLSEFNQVTARNGNRGSHGGLYSLSFFRVILDEAHHIKNRQSKTAKACYEIAAEHRWALTGTPIVNRLEDLFSLVRFLRVEPWSNFSFWKTFITTPFESKDFMRALDVVQTVLEPLVLRRTKDMKTPTGEALVPLPLKTVEIIDIELSAPEREVYDHIFTRAKRTFAANVEAGTVMKAYTSIFAQILRLRQSCCHPILTRNASIVADEEAAEEAADAAAGFADDMDLASLIARFTASREEDSNSAFGAHVLGQIRDEAESECPICAEEPMIQPSVTGCWHSACKKCLLDYVAHQIANDEIPRCFSCREPINSRDVFEIVRHEGEVDEESGRTRISLQRVGASSSAKIETLLADLKAVRLVDPSVKSVIFSQFTSFLTLIEPALSRASIPFLRLDGTMAQKSRAAVLAAFKVAKKGTVLLLSLRAGGVGLNLTCAQRVYMMDPWWSFAVEAQAIDRVHRMGQEKEVVVKRFVVKKSVEERMLKIQDRKRFM